MRKNNTKGKQRSIVQYEMLEECIRIKAQEFIQEVFKEEVNEFLGRGKSERIKPGIDVAKGYRNGYGKPRRLVHIPLQREQRFRGNANTYSGA